MAQLDEKPDISPGLRRALANLCAACATATPEEARAMDAAISVLFRR